MIDFRGVDLVLECPVDIGRVKRVLQSELSVPAERIAVIDDIAQYPQREDAEIVCVVSPIEGDFSSLLSIQTESIAKDCNDLLALVQSICEGLERRCLIPDEGPDPYIMWLISPNAPPERVGLDITELEEGHYVLE